MTSMKMILRALLVLAAAGASAPAGAQNAVDACRTGRVLENRPVRLSILPTNGSAPIELLLRYAGCQTSEVEPVMGLPTPPTAVRAYRADGIAWEAYFATVDGESLTELYIFYYTGKKNDPAPVAFFRPAPTDAIVRGRVDWGTGPFIRFDPPAFDFKARVVTQ